MLSLPLADSSLAGVIAFYSIVHFSHVELRLAFDEMHRVLQPGGWVLLAFHIGEGSVHVDEFLGHAVSLDFVFFDTQNIGEELIEVGFAVDDVIAREPYPDVEYPSRRAYLFARKPGCGVESSRPREPHQ
jgi:ubiquinone/menaquinone biosynthesis C-methylase UbiE